MGRVFRYFILYTQESIAIPSAVSSMLSSMRYFSAKRRSTAALVCMKNGNNAAVAAFSTLTSMLSDPSLLGDTRAHGGYKGGADDDDGDASSYFDVVDPGSSTGRDVIGRVRRMGKDDTRLAIKRAGSALAGWRDGTTASRRSALLYAWSALVKENSEDIATIMTAESGKPLNESRGEVAYGASFLDYYAAEAMRPNSAGGGTICPTPFAHPGTCAPRGRILAINEAVGVCGMITPWNFPIAMITRKAGPALAAGCTVVLKPSDLTPLTAVALSVLAMRAGIPGGVFELVTADASSTRDVGEEMCTNAVVRKVSFTGSTPVGKLLMKLSSDTVKRLSLELGGNAAFIGEPPPTAVSTYTSNLNKKSNVADVKNRYSFRGCGCRSRRRRRDGVEVQECRPDVRLRGSLPRAFLGRGRVRVQARREGYAVERRTRREGRRDDGSRHLRRAG
jgi:hypothetical protein